MPIPEIREGWGTVINSYRPELIRGYAGGNEFCRLGRTRRAEAQQLLEEAQRYNRLGFEHEEGENLHNSEEELDTSDLVLTTKIYSPVKRETSTLVWTRRGPLSTQM